MLNILVYLQKKLTITQEKKNFMILFPKTCMDVSLHTV